jgi:hypothetical protein
LSRCRFVLGSVSICLEILFNVNEFFIIFRLLEKAEAKLFGSYDALDGGQTSEALLDLTGEGAETIEIITDQFKPLMESGEVEKTLKKWKKTRFLMGASIVKEGAASEEKMSTGLLAGHAYSILDVKNPITELGFLGLIGNKRTVLLKVRNPWGEQEWNGDWSDHSPKWTAVTRKQLKLEEKNDGIFWMDMEDFFAHFNRLSVVRMYGTRWVIVLFGLLCFFFPFFLFRKNVYF